MALEIKDGAGLQTFLKTTLSGSDHMPHHIVQGVSGTVSVTSSLASPVYVSGTVTVSQPVNVDLVVGDTITASVSNTVTITASHANPVSVSINSLPVDYYAYSGGIYGALISKITQSVGEGLAVTSSKNQPLFVISDTDKPVIVANTAATPLYVTSSATYPFYVTASAKLPVELTGSTVKSLSGSATDAYVQVAIAPAATGSARRRFAPTGYTGPQYGIDATFDWSSAASGTVCLASASVSRKSLTITNPTADKLFISIGSDASLTGTNGLHVSYVSEEASEYSFILYPSGTYFAEPHNVGMFHGGYMISGSNSRNRIFVTETY